MGEYHYIGLILALAVLGATNVFLPQGAIIARTPERELPASKPVIALATAGLLLVVYGGLGMLGRWLSQKLGFPEIWDSDVSNVQRLFVPACIGVVAGIFLILVDTTLQRWATWGLLPHPPFPASVVASVTAAIGEEVIFRLFFIPFWMWVISKVLLRGRRWDIIFWIVAVFSALAFALGHLPGVMFVLEIEKVGDVPLLLIGEILLLNGVVSLFAAYGFRRYGFLAAVSIHLWTDAVWHVIWGVIG